MSTSALLLVCLAPALGGCMQTFDFATAHSPVMSQSTDVIERQTGEVSLTVASKPGTSTGGAVHLPTVGGPTFAPSAGIGSVAAVSLIGAIVLWGFGKGDGRR